MTSNQIAYRNAVEQEKHNRAVEAENYRHNFVNEKLQNYATAVQKYQVAVNNLHYTRMDNETERSNRAREAENERTNRANEQIREMTNAISAGTLQETSRHQKTLESLQSVLNASTQAANYAHAADFYADAGLKQAQATTEGYRPGQIVNEIDLTNANANLAREKLSTERTSQVKNVSSSIRDISGALTDVFGAVGNFISGAASSGGGKDFWSQMSRQLKKAK